MHVNLQKSPARHQRTHRVPSSSKWRYECTKYDKSTLKEQSCDLARAADVFNTVLSRKPEITVKPVPQRISVQQDHLPSLVEQRALHLTRDGRLSGAGNACEPNDSGLVA